MLFYSEESKNSSNSRRFEGLCGVKVVHNREVYQQHEKEQLQSERSDSFAKGLCLSEEAQSKVQNQESSILKTLWNLRPHWFRAFHCGKDETIVATVANVITSVPFVVLGLQAPRERLITRLYADSIIGVGIASSLFHTSRGEARKFFRWGDYTMIAISTLCLSKALHDHPKPLFIASAALAPFQPFLVAAVHTSLMEVTFAQRVAREPHLRMAHSLHAMSSLAGVALFVADDMYPASPFLHAAWHLTAALGIATCNKLLH